MNNNIRQPSHIILYRRPEGINCSFFSRKEAGAPWKDQL